MSNKTNVSGRIWAKPDSKSSEGESYSIVIGNRGWELPAQHLEPEDLRILADRIEKKRAEAKGESSKLREAIQRFELASVYLEATEKSGENIHIPADLVVDLIERYNKVQTAITKLQDCFKHVINTQEE